MIKEQTLNNHHVIVVGASRQISFANTHLDQQVIFFDVEDLDQYRKEVIECEDFNYPDGLAFFFPHEKAEKAMQELEKITQHYLNGKYDELDETGEGLQWYWGVKTTKSGVWIFYLEYSTNGILADDQPYFFEQFDFTEIYDGKHCVFGFCTEERSGSDFFNYFKTEEPELFDFMQAEGLIDEKTLLKNDDD